MKRHGAPRMIIIELEPKARSIDHAASEAAVANRACSTCKQKEVLPRNTMSPLQRKIRLVDVSVSSRVCGGISCMDPASVLPWRNSSDHIAAVLLVSRTASRIPSIKKVCAIQIVKRCHRGEPGNITCHVTRIYSGGERNDKGGTKCDRPRCEP